MTIEPLAAASLAVKLHLAGALAALGLGGYLLSRPKGTPTHKALGRLWVGLMLIVSISSFWIADLRHGRFSAIHLLSVFTLTMLGYALWQIRRGNVRAHRFTMIGVFVGGLVGAGVGTLAPGRLIPAILFGP
jgi:uncharacterized membrane protein